MAYVVLARKYRPQRFADLVGQEHVTRTLANAIAHNRVHHAYLFCGARGLGKTTTARLLAKCLVCVHGPTIDPCNTCSECVAVTEGRSVDVVEIDGASNNRVEDVRNLRDQVRYLPQTARRKIYIIDEVHMLTGSAFNALLKTLEEPPEHVTFIFATTEVHELPATILSRVSRFDLRRLNSGQLVAHLQRILANEGVEVEEAGLYTVARAGDGSVRDSLTLLDKVIAFASDTRKISADEVRVVLGVPSTLAVAGLVEAVLQRDPTLTLRRFDEVFASGQDLLALSLEFLKHLRDLMIVKLCDTRDVLVDASPAEFDRLRGQVAAVESTVLAQLFDRFTRVVDALPRTRVPRLVLEMGLLDLVHSEPLMPLGDLIDRLEQISAGTSPGGSPGSRGGVSRAAPATPQRGEPSRFAEPARAPASAPRPVEPARPAAFERGRAEAPVSEFSAILARSGLLVDEGNPRSEAPPPRSEPPRPTPARPADAASGPPPDPPWPGESSSSTARPPAATAGPSPAAHRPAAAPTNPAKSPPAAESRPPEECQVCPGSPQPAAAGVLPWATMQPFAAWEGFLERIRLTDPPLFALVAELGLAQLAGGVVKLAGTTFARDQLREHPQFRVELESLLHHHLGAPFRLEFIESQPSLPDLPSYALVEASRNEKLAADVLQEARSAPEIQSLMAHFDAKLRDVRPKIPPRPAP